MRHHRQTPTKRAAPPAFRTARPGLALSTIPPLLTLAVHLCVAGDPAR
ncbi:hypothetical protein ACH4VS_30190 [Streptomyces hygroscopicus]|nr:hypothetical protein [Streptomyces hygroscopicus]